MTDRYSDQEAAPLLRNDDEDAGSENEPSPTFAERVSALAQEPLTPLNQVLLVLALVLLLLCSVFLGLFLGEYTKLQRHVDEPQSTLTVTATSTQTVTATASPPGPTSPPAEAVCLTPACIELSAAIMSSMDQSQDPCEDFFRFTGGGWISAHPLPADKGSVGQFESLGQANKRILQDLLERPGATAAFTSTDDEKLLQKLRGFYDSCLNENLLDDLGTAPLIHFAKTLQSLYRGDSLETTQDGLKKNGLTAALAFLHTRGISSFFAFEIEGDVGVDPNFMVPQFDQADLGLPSKEYYEEESIVEVYQSVVERLLFTLSEEDEKLQALRSSVLVENAPWPSWPWPPWDDEPEETKPNRSDIAHEMAKKVIAFETKIANASLDGDLYQDPFFVYNRVPLSNLSESLPQVNFNEYFATFTPRNFPENVVVASPKYASDLSEILAATDSEVIESYLIVRAALNLAPNLGMATEAWQAQRTLLETLTGIKKGAVGDRAEYCIGKLEGALGFAAGRYFVNETFGGDSQEKAAKIITDIIESFKQSLPNVSWLDEPSAEAAAEKADAIKVKVGYPAYPNTLNPSSLLAYYGIVKIDERDYFGNMLSATASDVYKQWQKVGKVRNDLEWEMFPSVVNAYFNPPSNEIVFPAGILQPPFFSRDWPSYLSYGAFGQVAAHELTHAFDSAGRLYNQDGKLENWWTNASNAGFNLKQECIETQYSAYTIPDGKGGVVHVNGNLTSGENIGDSGLIQAYRAWKAQYEESYAAGNEFLLPGLKYTREQMFFIAFGRIWSNNMKIAAQLQRVRTDPHSPNIFRVEGTLYNTPEFAAAFNCPKGSKLNPPPEKQCLFWS